MSQIVVSNLTFCYEGSSENVFEKASFQLDTDWKLGFIGRNGKGKTTFLRLLQGKYEYQGSIKASTAFDYFPYTVTKEQEALSAAELFEKLRPGCEFWRVLRELEALSVDAECMYRPFGTLSHGERTKAMLALLFSQENFFLLVDEPTNHLDSAARQLVKEYLRSKKGFILVSHDRELLDACIDHVLVLNRATIRVEQGNFSSWWENKERADHFHRAENEKHLREIGKLKEAADRAARWADQNERSKIGFDPTKEHDRSIDTRAYIGAKTKAMQKRVKNTERRIREEIAQKEGLLKDVESPVELKLNPLAFYKERYLWTRELCLSYEGKTVLSDLTMELQRGERVLLRGANGCGKSSFLKAVLGKAGNAETGGTLEVAAGLIISYVDQDTSGLRGSLSGFARERGLDESLFKALLRQLDFERAQFEKRMEEYSAGQKKKVLLAASLLTPAHLYIWDEPLNFIDIFSRMQLERLILRYQPTMLLVEHDAVFGEKVATRIIELPDRREP